MQKHLRLRGENLNFGSGRYTGLETPPLARRKPKFWQWSIYRLRNTSACAEKTRLWQCTETYEEKHLRLRGENPRRECTEKDSAETPPLARRKRCGSDWSVDSLGNTSACAEKTLFDNGISMYDQKHLRLRGENRLTRKKESFGSETPPLARRKLVPNRRNTLTTRNTSACAEKTFPRDGFRRVR